VKCKKIGPNLYEVILPPLPKGWKIISSYVLHSEAKAQERLDSQLKPLVQGKRAIACRRGVKAGEKT